MRSFILVYQMLGFLATPSQATSKTCVKGEGGGRGLVQLNYEVSLFRDTFYFSKL